MSDSNKAMLRIDWFDGTLTEDIPSSDGSSSRFADEDQEPESKPATRRTFERKPLGFKRLLDLSMQTPAVLTLELSKKSSFWLLFDTELKEDFIVLIVKVISTIYRSLEPTESSMIISTLETKFLNSNFITTLRQYLQELPFVKINEKRTNSLFWDDVEPFYFNLLAICKGICDCHSKNVNSLDKVLDLLGIIFTSAVGVKEQHSERISDELFGQINNLKKKLLVNLADVDSTALTPLEKVIDDPNHFKSICIFPSKADLLDQKPPNIQPNIINGAYSSVEHYLDVQFKLLREDCFGPLRDGLCKYMNNPSKTRHENIRVYPKILIVRTHIANNKVGHLVDIAWSDRRKHGAIDRKRYGYSKQLMFGSLLLFTCDNFEHILCATVLDSNQEMLRDGFIAVSFQNPVSNTIFNQPFLMVESEVFFEPYHRVLKVVQQSKTDDLPMKKYIVDVQTKTEPPCYLTPETVYSIIEFVDFHKKNSYSKTEYSFPVLDFDKWPSNPFDFDHSQLEAFKLALTREFAVIQGPPGTGKTFIGVKIASTLLRNLSLEGTPILIICYTNHALDQFLEGILKSTETRNIVRLGSQSKSKVLENYNLNALRGKMKSKYAHLYFIKRSKLDQIYKQMVDIQTEIEKCEREILCYKSIRTYLKINDKNIILKDSNEDPVLKWLFGHLEDEFEMEDVDEEIDNFDDLEIEKDEKLETCFSEKWALKEIDSMYSSIKYIKDITEDSIEVEKMTEKFEDKIAKVRRWLNYFKIQMNTIQNENQPCEMSIETEDPHYLTPEQRWMLYCQAVRKIRGELMENMNKLMEQHNSCSQELNEVSTLIDSEVMKTARVVGVTTTTAARRHDLMRKLMSPIVIVEEAAEVLEAHIVASLTYHCQHLILIGDHKQLRPTAAHYKLAKHYNLEISLFERMIRNQLHARTLTTQRRMRANFASLLVPEIYEKLGSHPSVDMYPDVKGMGKNLFFFTHEVFEDSEGLEDSWSHKNTFEAKWCVALATYLRKADWRSEDITILATYTGQASLIKELSKSEPLLRNVKTTVVDNFQGEESRIVILSLVRSNKDGKIGFLAARNRVCVALSRAKEGLYIFGNMKMLKSASSIWSAINDKLIAQDAIGQTMTLRTKDDSIEISKYEEFESRFLLKT